MVTAGDRFSNPFFNPEYCRVISRVRPNVRVAVIREGDEFTGFFPFECDSRQVGRPVSGRLSDFQGIVSSEEPQLGIAELLAGCGLNRIQFDHWMADQKVIESHLDARFDSPFLDLSEGYEAFFQKRISQGSTRLKKVGQLTRKVARECGELVFTEHDEDPQAMELLLSWKSDQYRRTGALDIFAYPWVTEVLKQMSSVNADGFRGCMMTLRVAGRIVAVHLGMRTQKCVHWWFPAYDTAMGNYSPGLLMLMEGARYFASQGVRRIDLGSGDEAYKKSITTDHVWVAEGTVQLGKVRPMVRRGRKRLWETIRRMPGKGYLKGATALFHRLRNHYDFE